MRSLLLVLPLLACGGSSEDTSSTDTTSEVTDTSGDTAITESACPAGELSVTNITPDDLAEMMESKDFELINVHIPYAGEIEGTDIHISYKKVDEIEEHVGGDVTAKMVLYCLTGPMSEIAAEELVEKGYCNVYDMPAGMVGWEDAGYEVIE